MADAAAVPLWFVAREARKHVKVVLSGEGADELFGGYGVYYQPGVVRAGKALPGWGRATISRVAVRLPPGQRGKGLLSGPRRRCAAATSATRTSSPPTRPGLLARGGTGSEFDVTDPVFGQAAEAGLDDVATMQLVDINTWLPGDILVKADRMAMAHGLELRTPFLDREVMAVASRLARAEKTAAGTTKFALREAVGDLLPQAAAERAKLGFPVPIGHWLSGELSGFAEQVIREAQTDEWLDKRAATRRAAPVPGGRPRGDAGGRCGCWSCSRCGTRSTWSASTTRSRWAGSPPRSADRSAAQPTRALRARSAGRRPRAPARWPAAAPRILRRPRCSRDMTVPTGVPMISAISR